MIERYQTNVNILYGVNIAVRILVTYAIPKYRPLYGIGIILAHVLSTRALTQTDDKNIRKMIQSPIWRQTDYSRNMSKSGDKVDKYNNDCGPINNVITASYASFSVGVRN